MTGTRHTPETLTVDLDKLIMVLEEISPGNSGGHLREHVIEFCKIEAPPESDLLIACKKLMRLQHVQFVGSSEGDPINRDSTVAFAQAAIAKAEGT